VAASLYGPVNINGSCELILLYSGDLSCMRMKLSTGSSQVVSSGVMPSPPLERDVVQSWKDAAKLAVRNRQLNDLQLVSSAGSIGTLNKEPVVTSVPSLRTVCVLDTTWKVVQTDTSTTVQHTSNDLKKDKSLKHLPSQMPSSKRDTLTILQSTCPVEYLRQHNLNSSIDVVLRKANKGKLQKAWEGYSKYCSSREGFSLKAMQSKSIENDLVGASCHNIERIFQSILSESNDDCNKTIAAYLHESCDAELPCWGWDKYHDKEDTNHIFLFLGAVRDMTAAENEALSRACERTQIRLVPCRLGSVPEFTSKIVSVAGFHHFKGVLGSGLIELWERASRKEKMDLPSKRRKIEIQTIRSPVQRTIHNIAIVPMKIDSLSADPDKRDRVHWCIVRMVVCSLWRSKVASSQDDTSLNNVITCLFLDGISLTLKQKDFTSTLAENHKSAPSEYQVLDQMCRQRDNIYSEEYSTESKHKKSIKQSCINLARLHGVNNKGNFFVLNMSSQHPSVEMNLIDVAYSNDYHQTYTEAYTMFTIHDISSGVSSTSHCKKTNKIRKHLLSAFQATGAVAINHCTISHSCHEEEASTIIMLQHLDYQHCLPYLLIKYADNKSK